MAYPDDLNLLNRGFTITPVHNARRSQFESGRIKQTKQFNRIRYTVQVTTTISKVLLPDFMLWSGGDGLNWFEYGGLNANGDTQSVRIVAESVSVQLLDDLGYIATLTLEYYG